jgi:HEAT repeat protein
MALFGNGNSLSALVARAREEPPAESAELTALLERIAGHPECRPPALLWLLAHADQRVRAFGAAWLAPRADNRVVQGLLREIVGRPAAIRDDIARVLVAAAPRNRIEAAIGQMMHAPAQQQREAALSLIAALPEWQKQLRHLRVALRDPVPALRQSAVRILCRGGENRAIHLLLLDLLRDDDPAIRRQAVSALAPHPLPDVVEPFLERLSQEEPAEQALMTEALTRLAGNPEARLAERLMPVLADEDDRVREAAVRLLGQMPNATEILRSFLIYSRGLAFWLRDRAAASIMKISSDIVEPLGNLMQDPEEDIRIGAVVMASACRDPRIVPRTLEIFLGADDWWVRSIAAEVLGHFPSPEITQALQSRLEDPDLRASVIAVLAKMRDRESSECLVRCLGDADRGTRMATLEALAHLQTPEAYAALQQVALGDSESALRDKAVVILESHRPATEHYLRELAQAGRAATTCVSADGEPTLCMENDSL